MDDKKLDLILSKVEKIDKLEADMQDMKSDMQGMKSDMQDMKSDMQGMKSEMQDMKSDMQGMKSDMQGMKSDMQGMKADIQGLKSKVEDLDGKVTDIRLHLENSTDRNIQLLAENFIELTNKLNQAIPVADKNYAYEVKVNYLIEEVREIKKRMA